jgi:endonuclease/exonuclease/phosphatase family metal-dependent hydrolase
MTMNSFLTRAVRIAAFALTATVATLSTAHAQTPIVLDAPGTQVTDVMIQAGASANTNFNSLDYLATRASTNYDYLRRALLKFDTQNTIPAKSVIQSAVLTLTIKTGGAEATRNVTVYPVTLSFLQDEATWNRNRAGQAWVSAGGDLGPAAVVQAVPNVPGGTVNFDVTALVRAAVSGATSSRYTRLALADLGTSTEDSYREYYSSKAIDPSVRPMLRVVYGGTAPTTTVPAPTVPVIVPPCAVSLDKSSLSVGSTEANWNINVTSATTCAWTATSDADWLVVKSTSPAVAKGNGYAKVRAVANTVSASKRTGHFYVNGVVYTVTQGGCGTACTTTTPPVVTPPVVVPPVIVPPPPSGSPVTLKVLQFNTHHGGYGSDGVYSMDRIADWMIKSEADLISLNEIEKGDSWSKNQDQAVLYQQLMERRTGITWYMAYVNAHGATTGIGNVVLSKFPIIAESTHQLSGGRAAVDAMVDVNGRNVNFTSVHMDNLTESNRLTETAELLPWELGFAEERIICGDWNAGPTTTEIANMKATYGESWSAAKALGTAIGNGITHGTHQIDYIFFSKSATHLTLVSSQIYKTADANGVTPSDHEPILAVFEVR